MADPVAVSAISQSAVPSRPAALPSDVFSEQALSEVSLVDHPYRMLPNPPSLVRQLNTYQASPQVSGKSGGRQADLPPLRVIQFPLNQEIEVIVVEEGALGGNPMARYHEPSLGRGVIAIDAKFYGLTIGEGKDRAPHTDIDTRALRERLFVERWLHVLGHNNRRGWYRDALGEKIWVLRHVDWVLYDSMDDRTRADLNWFFENIPDDVKRVLTGKAKFRLFETLKGQTEYELLKGLTAYAKTVVSPDGNSFGKAYGQPLPINRSPVETVVERLKAVLMPFDNPSIILDRSVFDEGFHLRPDGKGYQYELSHITLAILAESVRQSMLSHTACSLLEIYCEHIALWARGVDFAEDPRVLELFDKAAADERTARAAGPTDPGPALGVNDSDRHIIETPTKRPPPAAGGGGQAMTEKSGITLPPYGALTTHEYAKLAINHEALTDLIKLLGEPPPLDSKRKSPRSSSRFKVE